MIVIVKTWRITILNNDCSCLPLSMCSGHTLPPRWFRCPLLLPTWQIWGGDHWIGLDYPCADDPVPISVLQEAIFILLLVEVPTVLGANCNVLTQHLGVLLWWIWWCTEDDYGHVDDVYGPNLVTQHLGVLFSIVGRVLRIARRDPQFVAADGLNSWTGDFQVLGELHLWIVVEGPLCVIFKAVALDSIF